MNSAIILEIVTLLDKIFPKNLYALDLTTELYKNLLQKLTIEHNEPLFNDKKSAIQKALIDYFAKTHQNIEVHVTFSSFALKKQFKHPAKPEAYDRMLHQNTISLIDIFERKSDFSPLPYLVTLPEKIRSYIFENFLSFGHDPISARQMTREYIEEIFNLNDRDIIFFLRNRITIRYYTPPKKLPQGADKRFGGESIEEMKALYNTYYPEGAWYYIEPTLEEVLTEKLNFSIIDNNTFNRMFVPVFRSMIEILLLEVITPEERKKIDGLTGYVLRQHFHQMLLFTSRNLLQYVENRDKNAEIFIKYFADEVIIDSNGNKVQKYAIIDFKQQKWNYSSIVSVMMQYKQVKQKIASQKETILIAENDLIQCQNELTIEKNNKDTITDKLVGIQEILSEHASAISRIKNQTGSTPEEMISLKSQINRLNYQETELFDTKKKINNQIELSKNKIANKISESTRRQRKLDYERKSLKNYIEQMASILESYETITEAIAAALTKR